MLEVGGGPDGSGKVSPIPNKKCKILMEHSILKQ